MSKVILDLAPINDLLTSEIHCEALATMLDNIGFKYATYALKDDEFSEKTEEATELYFLRVLRNRILAVQYPDREYDV